MSNPLFGGMANYGERALGATTPAFTPAPGYIANPGNRNVGGYQGMPVGQAQPSIPPTPMNQMLNSVQMNTPQSNLYWVKSPDAIPNYAIGRGWQQWFGDENEPKLYVREMDMNGVMLPLRTVWISETPPGQTQTPVESVSVPAQPVSQNQNVPIKTEQEATSVKQTPTREEFEALVKQTAETNNRVEELTKVVSPLIEKLTEFLK